VVSGAAAEVSWNIELKRGKVNWKATTGLRARPVC
jgi:hypothetical protein